jgi:hypothetical protein
MTDMTDTLTPRQKELTDMLYTMESWERINDFVVRKFEDANTRKRVLTALNATPMDADHIEWRGIVDMYIRRYL